MIINSTNSRVCQIQNQFVPDEGPKAIPLALDFAASADYSYDGSIQQNLGYISMLQTLWVDTSRLASPMTITIPGTQQTVTIPAQRQGYVNVLCSNPIQLMFTGTLGDSVGLVQLINVPIPTAIWATV